jgi:hypothetical protein
VVLQLLPFVSHHVCSVLKLPIHGVGCCSAVLTSIRIFPYPELPAYNGYGNVDDGSSFAGKSGSVRWC